MNSHTFRIIIEPDEGETYHGYVPRLPGCHTWGKTIEETRKNLQDAIQVYCKSLLDDGESIPEESGYELLETVMLFSAKDQQGYGN
ncbi:type II toxin-antitoxin system HicB family antitoxin [Candidatus Uhrbacteria bacterium]|nr:type II toxin-antitoxin system HicB family antitoxin [Candidatus Uhrbacteria bacterium]